VFYLRKTFGHNDPEEKKNSDAIKTEKNVWKKKNIVKSFVVSHHILTHPSSNKQTQLHQTS